MANKNFQSHVYLLVIGNIYAHSFIMTHKKKVQVLETLKLSIHAQHKNRHADENVFTYTAVYTHSQSI